MVQLARQYDGQTLTRLDELAQREEVSANFLVQILNDLKRSDLITSKRGKAGGYLLHNPPHEITLLHITRAVEPAMLNAEMSHDGQSGRRVSQAWQQVSQVMEKELQSITLDSLSMQSPMFYI